MDEQGPRKLEDYMIPFKYKRPNLGTVVVPKEESQFRMLKPKFLYLIEQRQFGGLPSENPYHHLYDYIELCNIVRTKGFSKEEVLLRAFSFSLRGIAKDWIDSRPRESFKTWDGLVSAFIAKFFPIWKVVELNNQITNFRMMDGENLYDCWERYKGLLNAGPHGLEKWVIVCIFYNAIDEKARFSIDIRAKPHLMDLSADDAYQLIEVVAQRLHRNVYLD